MTHWRAMAITSSKMATSHTCHNADEAVIKKKVVVVVEVGRRVGGCRQNKGATPSVTLQLS